MATERSEMIKSFVEYLRAAETESHAGAVQAIVRNEGLDTRQANGLIAEAMGLNLVESFVNPDGVRLLRCIPQAEEAPKPEPLLSIPEPSPEGVRYVVGIRPGLRVEVRLLYPEHDGSDAEVLAAAGWQMLTDARGQFTVDPIVIARIES